MIYFTDWCTTYPMEGYTISGIQQIGLGVPDVHIAWAWIRRHFGMDIPVFTDSGDAPFMTKYTGGKVHSRTATLAISIMGGGGFEIWQYETRKPEKPDFEVRLGDLGIFSARIKCRNAEKAYDFFTREDAELLGGVRQDPAGANFFFAKDFYGNIFQVIEEESFFTKGRHVTGGAAGCMIGVSDIEKAREVYSGILGYDQVIYDSSGTADDLSALPGGSGPEGQKTFRRVLLSHAEPRKGAFSRILGPSKIELVQCLERKPKKIFETRYWGDLGYIHLCFDIRGMDALEQKCSRQGYPFTVTSGGAFDMGEASGPFSYIEDPDGTLIEFVETHKIPINKAKGKYLDLTKRDPEKPLPNMLLKALRFGRVKD